MVNESDYEYLDEELTHEGCIRIPFPSGGYGWSRIFFDPAENRFFYDLYSTGAISDDLRYHGSEDLTLEEVKRIIPTDWPDNTRGVQVLNEVLERNFPDEPLVEGYIEQKRKKALEKQKAKERTNKIENLFEGIQEFQRYRLFAYPPEKRQIEEFLQIVRMMQIIPERAFQFVIPDHDDPQEILLGWQEKGYKMILVFPMDDFGWPCPMLLCGDGLSFEDVSGIIKGICLEGRDTGSFPLVMNEFRDITSAVFKEFSPG